MQYLLVPPLTRMSRFPRDHEQKAMHEHAGESHHKRQQQRPNIHKRPQKPTTNNPHYFNMPNIILKKTFKVKPSGFQVAAEKSFSMHGSAVTPSMISAINQKLSSIQFVKSANRLQFKPDTTGHYSCAMNHDCQKYNEEDVVVAILDVMEVLGWSFRFQYDSESHSAKVNGSSFTSRELFIFHKSG